MRSTPSPEVNSVIIKPHPPRLRMKRRKTGSVTPAMGARTVAGEIVTAPMVRLAGTGFSGTAWRAKPALSLSKGVPPPHWPFELSQNFFTVLFYLPHKAKALTEARAEFCDLSAAIREIRGECYFAGAAGAAASFFAY